MKVAAVSELKARLSEYLNHVKTGEEVVITDRGRPVARLIAVRQNRPDGQRLTRMAKQGLIRVGTGKIPASFWNLPRQQDTQATVLEALFEERREGR